MKKLILFLLMIISTWMVQSCTVMQPARLKGEYHEPPYIIEIDKPFEEVWEKILDYATINGWNISILSRENGVIWTEKLDISEYATVEMQEKSLKDDRGWVVIPPYLGEERRKNPSHPVYPFLDVKAEVNFRLKSISETKTVVYINLVNISAIATVGHNVRFPVKSTGVLESFLADMLKK